jgi:hypothetical protein
VTTSAAPTEVIDGQDPTTRPRVGPRVAGWLTPALPRNRLALLRLVAYAFAVLYVFRLNLLPVHHAALPADLYQPLQVARLVPIVPRATPTVVLLCRVALLAGVVTAVLGRLPRLSGTVVALAYAHWLFMASSYGKVDHDQVGFLLLLFALPTAGRLSLRDGTLDERAGWVLRMTQLGAVATYFLSALAKLRFGGPGWVNSGTLARAIARRGTSVADWVAEIPHFVHAAQWVTLAAELLSPLLFVPRWTNRLVAAAFGFHAVTFALLTIGFWPHQVSLLAFLPLEAVLGWRLWDRWRSRDDRDPPAATSTHW